MKKLILSITVLSLVLLTTLLNSCRKPPRNPEDPCKHKVTVTATNQDEYYWGHFRLSNPNQTDMYLHVNNWDQYASKVVPGRQYKIAYKEVACEHIKGCEGQDMNGIREGGCVLYPNKCIMIECLEEVRQDCFETYTTTENEFSNVYSQANSSSGIFGNALRANVSFSGCSASDAVKFKLYAMESGVSGSLPVWMVKAVNINTDITCQAVFAKEVCFDLTPLSKIIRNTLYINNEVVIRLVTATGTQDFKYKF